MATQITDLPNGIHIEIQASVQGPRIEELLELDLLKIRRGVVTAEGYGTNPTNKETLWKPPYHTLNDILLFSDNTPHVMAKMVMEEYPIILEKDLKDVLSGLDQTVVPGRTSSTHLIPDIAGLLRILVTDPRTGRDETILVCIGVTELKRMLSRKLTMSNPFSGRPRSRAIAVQLGNALYGAAIQATGQVILNIKSLRVYSKTESGTDFPPWVPTHLYLLIGVGGWVSFALINTRKFELGQRSESFEDDGDDVVMGDQTAHTPERYNTLVDEIIELGEGVENSSYWVEEQQSNEGVPMELEGTNGFKPRWDRNTLLLRTNVQWTVPIYLRDRDELQRALLDWRRQIHSRVIQPVVQYLDPVQPEEPQ